MSAFSRGCLLRQQCAFKPRTIHIFFQPINTPPQFFSTTSLLHAARKSRPSPKPKTALPSKFALPSKPSLTPTKSTPTINTLKPTIYTTYAQTLAQKSHPTLLYEAPSQTLFIISSYSAAIFCFGWAGYNVWANYLVPSPGLAEWVPVAFMGIAIFMMGCGTWLIIGTTRIVRTITAVPKSSTNLQIEILLRKDLPIPFLRARRFFVKPEEIMLPEQLSPPPPKHLSAAEIREMRIEDERRRKQELEYEQSHLLTSPFRHMSRALFGLFKAMGRTWTREGFLKVEAKGQVYKLDVNGGWALDGGRALDRLATVKNRV